MTTTPNKAFTKPVVGGDNNVWGNELNDNFDLIDSAVGATLIKSISTSVVLTGTEVENAGYHFIGTISGDATITFPVSFFGMAVVRNATTGGHNLVVTEGGATVTVANGETVAVWSDGTDFIRLAIAGGGGIIQNAGLANSSITIAGHSVSLGGSQAIAAADLSDGASGSGSVYLEPSPVAKTADYTATNNDKHKILYLGGTTQFRFTIGPASGFDSDYSLTIINSDTDDGKKIDINGYDEFILWPLQQIQLRNINNVWKYPPQDRWRCPQGTLVYVDPTGTNANDGLRSSRPMVSILEAWNRIRDQFDGQAGIQLTAGATYDVGIGAELIADTSGHGFGKFTGIHGDETLVNPPIIQTSVTGGTCLNFRDGGWGGIGGIKFTCTTNGCIGVAVSQKALADIQNCIFDHFPTGSHINITDGGDCNLTGTIKIVGEAASHLSVGFGGKIVCGTITIDCSSAAMNFVNGFILVTGQSRIDITPVTFTNAGSVTGIRYALSRQSMALTSGQTIPGSIAGDVDASSIFV